jgi:hypothetical protein
MPKESALFTDISLRKLPIPLSGQVTYRERGGLSVRVSQGGTKTFFVTLDGTGRRYRIAPT